MILHTKSRQRHAGSLVGCSAAGVFATAVIVGLSAPAHAAYTSYTWTTGANGTFEVSSNWTPATAPSSSNDLAYFNNAGTNAYTVTLNADVTNYQLRKDVGTDVTVDLGGHTYSLTSSTSLYLTGSKASASPVAVTLTNGTLSSTNVYVGAASGTTTTGNAQLTLTGSSAVMSVSSRVAVGYAGGNGIANFSNGSQATVASVIVGDGSGANFSNGALNVTGGSKLTVGGLFWISYVSGDQGAVSITGAGSSVNVTADNGSGSVRIGSANTGSLTIAQGGNLSTVGDVYLLSKGSLLLDGSTITAGGSHGLYSTSGGKIDISGLNNTITGNVALAGTTVTTTHLVSTSAYGKLTAAGAGNTLTLNGTLNVLLDAGFQPVAGNSFDLFDWTNESGQFTTVNLPTLNAGLKWDQTQLYSDGTIKVAALPEPTSLGLIGVGLAGLLTRRKRRQGGL